MTDALTDTDQTALKALGIDLCNGLASAVGVMTVEVTPHGAQHLKVEVRLPSGGLITTYMARWQLSH